MCHGRCGCNGLCKCHMPCAICHNEKQIMLLARVTGTLVATQKHRKLEGAKLLFVQPLTLEDTPRGPRAAGG